MIWIGYTTRYREGGHKFARAAHTLANEKRAVHDEVQCQAVESKREFVDAMGRLAQQGKSLSELHFIGHSGMYGPMFRTRAMPEQFSPHEWRTLALPFSPGARAYFHACRTARWFAPFFARTYGVQAFGYHHYTTLSLAKTDFIWEKPWTPPDAPLFVIACPGKKSHGLWGSIAKYGGFAAVEEMKSFEPASHPSAKSTAVVQESTYAGVAELYDAAFEDISVRAEEVSWLEGHLPRTPLPRVLDLGCGNGALLARLSRRIAQGAGVDSSPEMIAQAAKRASDKLSFQTIDGPRLPFANASFDVVVSMLSFRYLDWDPIMQEIRRVLVPDGRLLVVDMVTVPVRMRETPRLLKSKVRQLARHALRRRFAKNLKALVADPRWKQMLAYNPIRSEHEFKWYLESRFPGRRTELLTVAAQSRVLAFDSGPFGAGWTAHQSYP